MMNLIARFVREDRGQDLVEYALLLGLITVAVAGAVTTLGGSVLLKFQSADAVVNP